MSKGPDPDVPVGVIEALDERFGPVTCIGAGAWSTAFGFTRNGRDLVVRVGEYVSDFLVDAEMSAYASPSLPIPQVIDVDRLDPPHDRFHLCVSTFAPGRPLEMVAEDEWSVLVPAVADLFEALRAVGPPSESAVLPWSAVLLGRDESDGRLAGWKGKLSAHIEAHAAYQESMAHLTQLCELASVSEVTQTLLHCDMINRNVHVQQGRITGVFDWGCRRWGDHLYDLAWMEFWAPWHPNLDIGALRDELVTRWQIEPDVDRFSACLVHIGADHLIYNAVIDDTEGLGQVRARMIELDLI